MKIKKPKNIPKLLAKKFLSDIHHAFIMGEKIDPEDGDYGIEIQPDWFHPETLPDFWNFRIYIFDKDGDSHVRVCGSADKKDNYSSDWLVWIEIKTGPDQWEEMAVSDRTHDELAKFATLFKFKPTELIKT